MTDKKLRVAVCGVGDIGTRHVAGVLYAKNAELVALCDERKQAEIMELLQKKFTGPSKGYFGSRPSLAVPDVPYYRNFREMLENEKLDLVIIASPDATHSHYTNTAMVHGVDVLCEKPLTMTNAEAMNMLRVAKKYKRRFFVGQVCRFTPVFIKAKELVDAGEIGNVFCIEAQYVHGCHANAPDDHWRKNPPRPATACGGCHAFDLVRYLAGNPEEVFAYGNRFSRLDWTVEDCSETIMRFPDGKISRVLATIGCVAAYSMRLVVYGTKGTITTNNTWDYVEVYKGDPNNVQKIPQDYYTHNIVSEIERTCDAILKEKASVNDGIEGAMSLLVCNAAIASMTMHQIIQPDYTIFDPYI